MAGLSPVGLVSKIPVLDVLSNRQEVIGRGRVSPTRIQIALRSIDFVRVIVVVPNELLQS